MVTQHSPEGPTHGPAHKALFRTRRQHTNVLLPPLVSLISLPMGGISGAVHDQTKSSASEGEALPGTAGRNGNAQQHPTCLAQRRLRRDPVEPHRAVQKSHSFCIPDHPQLYPMSPVIFRACNARTSSRDAGVSRKARNLTTPRRSPLVTALSAPAFSRDNRSRDRP